jgi:peptide/nickel transport system ATP-binding protein
LLEVQDLDVRFFTRHGALRAVRSVSFNIDRGETFALVGESGSGKSVTTKAILGLVDRPGRVVGGDIRWKGSSLVGAENSGYRRSVLGREITIVFQDPLASLNPLLKVGTQITEVLRHHRGMSRGQARERAVDLLGMVGISNPTRRLDQHPHEFSGGMSQRVLIAMALASEPELLIADEPTTALDVTIQAQILELIMKLQQDLGLAVLFVTHDLGVVATVCQRVAVMYSGRIVEQARVDDVFRSPGHPYTHGLLRATPRPDGGAQRLSAIEGAPPDPAHPPAGCAYHPRCPLAIERCMVDPPLLVAHASSRDVACHRAFQTIDFEAVGGQ